MPTYTRGPLSTAINRPDLADAMYQWVDEDVRWAADEIFPIVEVPDQAGMVEVVTRESLLGIPNVNRAPGGYYNEIDDELTSISYNCSDKGLEASLLYGGREFFQYNEELGKVIHINTKMKLAREKFVMDSIMDTTTFANQITTPASAKDWSAKDSNPKADVKAAKKAVKDRTGLSPNAIVMSGDVLDRLLEHPNITKYYQNPTTLTDELIESELAKVLLGSGGKIIVSDAMYSTAAEGLKADLASIAGSTYVNVCRVGRATPQFHHIPSIGWTFLWKEDSANMYTVESYESMKRRARIFRSRHNTDENLVEPAFGQLIKIAGN